MTNMQEIFRECGNLEEVNLTGKFSTDSVTTMHCMFMGCSKLEELDLSNFTNPKVQQMSAMFKNCSSLKSIDLTNFGTESVSTMAEMFEGCKALEGLDVSSFNTIKVKEINRMFCDCAKLKSLNLDNFNTENVTNMDSMFNGCTNLVNLDVSSFNTSKVKSMVAMFNNCNKLVSLDVTNFDTSKVTNMSQMFRACYTLKELDVSNFDTSSVTNMGMMFFDCSGLKTLDLSSFNTANVTNMNQLLYNDRNLESVDLSSFELSGNTSVTSMFGSTSSLKSVLVSNKFVIPTGVTGLFGSIPSIITTSTIPVENQFKGNITSKNVLYVPNGSEEVYAYVLNGDTDVSKIEPILQRVGEENISVLQNSEYADAGYTIAGFTETQLAEMNSGDASLYGYRATTTSDVDTSTLGEYEVKYTMNRTDKEGNQLAEPTTVIRTVIVVDAPVVIVYEQGSEYDGEWTQNDVTVAVEILSPSSNWIEVKLGDSEWTQNPTYTEIKESGDKLAFTLTETINETIYVREIDASGTATSNSTKGNQIKIDKVKPIIDETKSKTIDQEVYVKANVSDVGSGVAYIAITLTEDETRIWEECTVGSEEILHKLDKTGTYYVWVKDAAGMESEAQILKATKDVKAPQGSIDIVEKKEYSGDKYTNEEEVTININVTDNESTPEETKFALYTEEEYEQIIAGTKEIVWQDYAPTVTWPLKEGEGLNRIYAIFKDLAGNVTK